MRQLNKNLKPEYKKKTFNGIKRTMSDKKKDDNFESKF